MGNNYRVGCIIMGNVESCSRNGERSVAVGEKRNPLFEKGNFSRGNIAVSQVF